MVYSILIAQFVPQILSACGAPMHVTLIKETSVSVVLIYYVMITKSNFTSFQLVLDLGLDDDTGYRKIQVSIDSTYACTVFSSCKGTSFIAAAAVSSSIAFFNFLGYNGAPYSLSIITFKE